VGPEVETSFTPEIYATFIFSRWIFGDPVAAAAREWVECRICSYIQILGKPKTIYSEKRAAVAALLSLSLDASAQSVRDTPTEMHLRQEQVEALLARAGGSRK
jgi:hypothetical protein